MRDLVSVNSVEEELRMIPTSVSDIQKHAYINKCAPSTHMHIYIYVSSHKCKSTNAHIFRAQMFMKKIRKGDILAKATHWKFTA